VILPLLGVIEKPLEQPKTIEDDFNARNTSSADTSKVGGLPSATPAE
jgi:ubiquinol-cytochrome c reductase cytochrome b subunit